MTDITEGSKAPAFDMATAEGGRVSLDGLKGRKVVLYFYPKADTPGCTSEARDFSEHIDAFAAAGATVIGGLVGISAGKVGINIDSTAVDVNIFGPRLVSATGAATAVNIEAQADPHINLIASFDPVGVWTGGNKIADASTSSGHGSSGSGVIGYMQRVAGDNVTIPALSRGSLNLYHDTDYLLAGDINGSGTLSFVSLMTTAATASVGAYLELKEAANNGTNYIRLQAPATLAADKTYTLPATDGSNGDRLTTDGSGTLSWSAVTTGASYSIVRTQSGTTYTLVLGDAGDYIQTTSTTAVRNASAFALISGVAGLAAAVPGSMDATLSNCTGWPFSSKLSLASKIGNR